jgi:hypothetical protein
MFNLETVSVSVTKRKRGTCHRIVKSSSLTGTIKTSWLSTIARAGSTNREARMVSKQSKSRVRASTPR